jgi:hypothetical protein
LRTLRVWLALCCSVALVVTFAVRVTVAQFAPANPFATDTFADASGGAAGSAAGGDGGRGGAGTGPICNQNTDDGFETEWWEGDSEPTVACGAGGRGGDAGDAGESIAGNGGVAFTVGFAPPPSQPIRNPFADVFIRNPIRLGSFLIDVANAGPDVAHGVKLVVTLEGEPPSSFASAESSRGSCAKPASGTSISAPVTITCDLGDVAVGDTVTVTIEWTNENECAGTATVNATVSSASPPDPDLTNNTGSASQTKGVPC